MCESMCVLRCVCAWRPEDDIGFSLIVHHIFGLSSLTSEADRLSNQPQDPPVSSPHYGLTISSGCAGF